MHGGQRMAAPHHAIKAIRPLSLLLVLKQAEDADLNRLTVVGVADVEQVMTAVYLHVWRGEDAVSVIFKTQELLKALAIRGHVQR